MLFSPKTNGIKVLFQTLSGINLNLTLDVPISRDMLQNKQSQAGTHPGKMLAISSGIICLLRKKLNKRS
jgi:hypothetical protein